MWDNSLLLAPGQQADAVHFSAELPHIPGGTNTILYPASNKAATTLQVGAGTGGLRCRYVGVCCHVCVVFAICCGSWLPTTAKSLLRLTVKWCQHS